MDGIAGGGERLGDALVRVAAAAIAGNLGNLNHSQVSFMVPVRG
jgi:hypothetical protein